MENVTFVSNSHQRPAADNLQKLKSLLTNTRQQIKSQTQQVTIKNLYVSSFTLQIPGSKLKVRLSRLPSKIFM